MNIAQAGYGAGNGPIVFFNSSQIFLQFVGDTFPERNFLSRPLFNDAGILFRYLRMLLASASSRRFWDFNLWISLMGSNCFPVRLINIVMADDTINRKIIEYFKQLKQKFFNRQALLSVVG